MKILYYHIFLSSVLIIIPALLFSQTVPTGFTLDQCVKYALENQVKVKESILDQSIMDKQIKATLSGWLPQIALQYNLNYYFKLQTAVFADRAVTIGTKNSSNVLFQANQMIYSNDLLFAFKGANFARTQTSQNTENVKISLVVEVSKAFYDILLSQAQLRTLDENIVRQEKQYKDAFTRYESGVVDKTDYQRASITLANSRSQRRGVEELIKPKLSYLKQLLNYPSDQDLILLYENTDLEKSIYIDTTQAINYEQRIEYKQLRTRLDIAHLNTMYNKQSYLPTIFGFANYNQLYFSNQFSKLYSKAFPTSAAGVTVYLPLFTGTRRIQNIRIAHLQEKQTELEMQYLKNYLNTEYQAALASYKSNYVDWLTLRQNVIVAREVYDIIKLQYDEGIKAYVDLIVAETELKSSEILHYNALYRLLSSKLDLQKALGEIEIE